MAKTPAKGALAKDPPLRGQARQQAQSQQRTPGGNVQAAPDTSGSVPPTQTAATPPSPQQSLKRVSPGIYRNAQGQLTNAKGQRIDRRGRPVNVDKTKGPAKPQGLPNAPAGSVEEQFRNLSPEQQNKELYADAGSFYNQMMGNAMKFDPNNPTVGYEQGFNTQMEQARQNVMDQFERTMQPQFQKEQMDFQQRMAEQGIDPNSGAYQSQYKAMMDAQNAQRLNAQSQAFQLGAGYQQQGFEQAITGQTTPFQMWQAASDPWKLQYAAGQEARQAELNRQAQLQAQRISAGAGVRSAQISADASRYAADLNALNQGYGQQQQKPDWRNEAIKGVVAGGTAAALK